MIAELPGAKIWYEDGGGGGVPVVFLHAGTGSIPMWVHQLPVFGKAGYRCIAYDRRGYGKTEIDPAAPQDAVPAEDLHGLLQHLGIERVHIVGTAAGGIVALDFVLSHASRVRSLVIANSIGGVQDEDYLDLMRRLRPAPQFDALPPDVRELGPSYRAANPEGVKRWLELERASRPRGPRSLPATRNRITFAALETLRVPTLLLTGDADLYTPPPVLELFGKRIGSSTSMIVPACGHSAYWEQPALFNRVVLEFLAQS